MRGILPALLKTTNNITNKEKPINTQRTQNVNTETREKKRKRAMSIFNDLPEVENIATNITPGDILKENFLDPLGITPYRLAIDTGLTPTRISGIINKNRAITAETALKIGQYFNTSGQFWLNLQSRYDLRIAKEKYKEQLTKIKHLPLAPMSC